MTKHMHADLMLQYAQDAMTTDTPWELWEFSDINYHQWRNLNNNPTWYRGHKYRRKPQIIRIGGYEVPEPVRKPLKEGTLYYTPLITCLGRLHDSTYWRDDVNDRHLLRSGLVHLNHENAITHAKALISLTESTNDG